MFKECGGERNKREENSLRNGIPQSEFTPGAWATMLQAAKCGAIVVLVDKSIPCA